MSTLRARMIVVKASSQKVQVFGFIRLGLRPKARNGSEVMPRSGTGRRRFCQHPLHINDED